MVAGACGLGLAAVLPGAAAGATSQAQAGDFAGPPSLTEEMTSFYPKQVVVHQGDKVKFSILGFHTVTFPKAGSPFPRLLQSDGANPAANDPAGAPYWWSGTTRSLMINPTVVSPAGGTTVTGARTVSSGAPQGNRPSFTVTFPRTGTFQVLCLVHPTMKGSVKVLPSVASAPTSAELARRAAKQKAADRQAARDLIRKAPSKAGASDVLIGPGDNRATILAFFPKLRTVTAGSDVTFRMGGRNEIHTVTFGPQQFVGQVAKKTFEGSGLGLDSEGTLPTDPPALGPPSVSPAAHGNGFVSSGILADPGMPVSAPHRFTFRFSTPGVYSFTCLVHPEMKGRIVVTA
jgi:plastocyanin